MILVTGGTGFIGSNIVRELVKRNHKVKALVHSGGNSERIKNLDLTLAHGDVTDVNSLEKAFTDVKIVYNVVGIIRETKRSNFDSIHVLGTKNLVEISNKVGVEYFVHISSLGTRPNAVSRYHQTKWKAEQSVVSSGIPYTIFRPSVVFGPDDEFINMLARMIQYMPIFPLINSGGAKMQPVYVGDLAKCVVDCLNNPQAKNKIFEIGGPDRFTVEEIVELIKGYRGFKRLKLRMPYKLMFGISKTLENFFWKVPVSTDQLIMLREDNICDNLEAEKVFKIKFTSIREGLKSYWQD
ncbi:MAG: hypothetical protein A2145_01020 [candidate division Zixibacteria bacterium RBG_16_40_9]|nr:MAG: hypothetical protein A2145_01020 [candidate division Zixibacteria bacterium RBG_16_40_9]